MLDVLRDRHGQDSEEYRDLSELRKEIIVAALLHDVGHGPFSHVFERALPAVQAAPDGYPDDHEGWSERIISECFGPLLEAKGVRVDVVAGLINKKNRKHLLAKDFISSQLDADRMDYLLRDSRATGPKYGEFDLEWLMHCLRIGKVRVRGQKEGVWRLCFDSRKAIHVVEEYIQAREFMYVQVYIHKTTRAYEAMLKSIFGLAAAICAGDPGRAPSPCPAALAKLLAGRALTVEEYLSLDDFRLWTTFVDWSLLAPQGDGRLSMLSRKCAQLVNREQPYKFIDLDNREKQDKALELVGALKETDLQFSCVRDAFTDLAYRNARYRTSKEDDEEEDRVIHFIGPDGVPRPAENLPDAGLIRAMSDLKTEIYRLYYDETDPAIMKRLREIGWVKPDLQEGVRG
jgi:hypothetical protein